MYDKLSAATLPQTPIQPPVQQQVQTQHAPIPNQVAQPAPGMPGGTHPQQEPQPPVTPAPNAPVNATNLLTQLDSYKAKLDNDGNPIAEANPNALQQGQVPKYEEFAGSAEKLAATIQMDETQVQAALGGDPAAFQQIIQAVTQQTLQQAMHMSANFASSYAFDQAGKVTNAATANIADSATEQTAIDAAMQIVPNMNNDIGASLVQQRIKELRAQFPTAPAELLGQYAAAQLQELNPNQAPVDGLVDQTTDWSSQF